MSRTCVDSIDEGTGNKEVESVMYGVYMITNVSEETFSVSINRIHNTRCYEILLAKGLGLHENNIGT